MPERTSPLPPASNLSAKYSGAVYAPSTPHSGRSSRPGSGAVTPRALSEMSAEEKDEELMDAYKRIAELQAENEKLRTAVIGPGNNKVL